MSVDNAQRPIVPTTGVLSVSHALDPSDTANDIIAKLKNNITRFDFTGNDIVLSERVETTDCTAITVHVGEFKIGTRFDLAAVPALLMKARYVKEVREDFLERSMKNEICKSLTLPDGTILFQLCDNEDVLVKLRNLFSYSEGTVPEELIDDILACNIVNPSGYSHLKKLLTALADDPDVVTQQGWIRDVNAFSAEGNTTSI